MESVEKNHPWNDLPNEELTKMVKFCNELFTNCSNCKGTGKIITTGEFGSVSDCPVCIQWEWNKGDWFAVQFNDDIYIHLVEKVSSTGISYTKKGKVYVFDIIEWIPLPLVHQWPSIIKKHIGKIFGGIYTEFDTEELGVRIEYFVNKTHTTSMNSHRNHSYAYCLALKEVIENG
jgi:hypothetical protein